MIGRAFVLSACLVAVTACSGAAGGGSSSPTVASSPNAGLASIGASVIGGANYPSFTVKAPSPWFTDGHFVHVLNPAGGVVLGFSVWDVGRVPRNPCHPLGHTYDPGSTVSDLASALAAQQMRNATTPTDVTLGGYPGQYLQWSVPAGMTVTGGSDFAGCDVQGDGHREFVSWDGHGTGERYQQMAGQVDRLWVLDVNGQRLVVDATYAPDTSQAQRDELGQVATSLRFNAPAAPRPLAGPAATHPGR